MKKWWTTQKNTLQLRYTEGEELGRGSFGFTYKTKNKLTSVLQYITHYIGIFCHESGQECFRREENGAEISN